MNKQKRVRLNLVLTQDFYEQLKIKAGKDFIPVGTWVRQYLLKTCGQVTNI